MKTKNVNWILRASYVIFMIALMLILGVTKGFGQRKQIIEYIATEEPTVAFRYDGFENPIDAPAFVSIETLENDEIERKMEQYNPQGLPSMEQIKATPIIMTILQNVLLSHLIKEEGDERVALRHLIKDDTLGFLIKEEGDEDTAAVQQIINDDTLGFLIKEDDGAHSA